MESTSAADQQLRAVGLAAAWAIVGLFGSQVFGVLLYSAVVPLFGTLAPTLDYAVLMICSGIGLVIVAGVYLRIHDLDLGYVDVAFPSLRDLGYTVFGVVVLLAGIVAISLLFFELGIQGAQHSIVEQASENNNPELLLALVPLSLVVVGPTEELFFRNIVQKSLYDHFDRRHAVVVASVLFALIHFPAYYTSTLQAAASSVAVILVLSLVLGEWYRRTDNLVVPILVHGIFNAIQFSLAYVQVRYELAEATLTALV